MAVKVIKTIKELKLLPFVSVGLEDSSVDVAKKLKNFQERRVFVLDEKQFPVGIISLIDINDRLVAENKNLKKTKARDIMSCPIRTILDINTSFEDARNIMIGNNNYYIPIVEKGKLKGLLNYSTLLKGLQ